MSLKDYQMMAKLGAGSFGIVYKAKNKKTAEICVIKEIDISKLDARLKKWAMNEAQLMKQIDSKYIVRYYASFLQKSKLYIVMEYCNRGDLSIYIKGQMGKPIKQEIIWKFSIQMMVGLHDLHSKKILHRDIKALNIFLDSNQDVRIGDLGVAKTMSTDFTNTIVGTPYYLSPEMCEEKPYNEKTDIWAMGCLIYQLCTGKHPFQAQNQAALALKIVMGKFKDIPSIYSKDLDWLVKSCLSVDYKRRPSVAYILQKPRIKQQAKKLGIQLSKPKESQKIQQKKQQKKIIVIKKQLPTKYNVPQSVKIQSQNEKKKISNSSEKNNDLKTPKSVSNLQNKNIEKSKSKQKIQIIKTNDSKKQIVSSVAQTKKVIKNANIPPAIYQAPKKGFPPQQPALKIKQKESSPPNQKQQLKKQVLAASQKKCQQNQLKHDLPTTKTNSVHEKQVKSNTQQSQASNNYMQKIQNKKLIDVEDEKRIKQQELEGITNIDLLDISQKTKPKINNKKATFVGLAQRQVDDDMLMAQFGITPQKKQILKTFQLKQAKNINWDLQSSSNSSLLMSQNSQFSSNGSKSKSTSQHFKQLPTIKSTSQCENVTVIMQNSNQNQKEEDEVVQQLDDNQPYKSDSQNQQEEHQNQQENQQFQQDDRYLIQNIQAQIEEQEKNSLKNQIQTLNKKIQQNKKRLKQLQRMKDHTQKQYFNKLPSDTYKLLQQKIKNDSDQKEVQELMMKLSKGNNNLLIKFYRVFHYGIQIGRCQQNVLACQKKIDELKRQKKQ